MKKLSDLMKELGFNEDAPESTGKAFINNLLRASQEVANHPENRLSQWETKKIVQQSKLVEKSKSVVGEQLSFHFSDLASDLNSVPGRKKSS